MPSKSIQQKEAIRKYCREAATATHAALKKWVIRKNETINLPFVEMMIRKQNKNEAKQVERMKPTK